MHKCVIHVNQLGYCVKDKKIAITSVQCDSFDVIEKVTGKVVYSGSVSEGKYDNQSGDTVYYIDFSSFEKSGVYYIALNNNEVSYEFEISENLYKNIRVDLLKFLYYQRCGIDIIPKFADGWTHKACHTKKVTLLVNDNDNQLDVTGGWHDAGDYGKYTVPIEVTIGHLLMTYEFFPEMFMDIIHIPESDNGTPDILNEARYGLEWLFKMQDILTGGVYHKVTSKDYPPRELMPEDDKDIFYICPVSSQATGAFAAVMAKASVLFKDFDDVFAKKCMLASEKAWKWLTENEGFPTFKNPEIIVTYDYAVEGDYDHRYWAASELYNATGDIAYEEYMKHLIQNKKFDIFGLGWKRVGGFGTICYIQSKQKKNAPFSDSLKKAFLNRADQFVESAFHDGYLISLNRDDYEWGSNLIVLNNAMHLIIAGILSKEQKYYEIASNHIDYVLGRNSLSQSFISGYGKNTIQYPHHRIAMANMNEKPIRGMVSGGPNIVNQDEHAMKRFEGTFPAKCFEDDNLYYSINEVATYWNTPAIFAFAFLDKKINDSSNF